MAVRRITGLDRMLQHGDQLDKWAERPKKKRRRSAMVVEGKPPEATLDVVILEETGEPTTIFVGEPDSSAGVLLSVRQFEAIKAFVQKVLSQPPPVGRRR